MGKSYQFKLKIGTCLIKKTKAVRSTNRFEYSVKIRSDTVISRVAKTEYNARAIFESQADIDWGSLSKIKKSNENNHETIL